MWLEVLLPAISALVSALVGYYFGKEAETHREAVRADMHREEALLDLHKMKLDKEPLDRVIEYETPTGTMRFRLDVTDEENVRDFVRTMRESSGERVAGVR